MDFSQRDEEEAPISAQEPLKGGFGSFPREQVPPSSGFSGFPQEGSKFFLRGQRQRMDIVSACQCLILPWIAFCLVYAVMSFRLHYTMPWLCYCLVGVGLLFALIWGWLALNSVLKKIMHSQATEPNWLVFFFCTTLIAWVLGTLLGNINFWTNMQPYYDYAGLGDYDGVDPAKVTGPEMMDAGRIHFLNSSTLDLTRAMGFKDGNTYCVAPITVTFEGLQQTVPLANYDFWAVGLECCSPNVADFHCGPYNSPDAHGGLRLLRDDQRSFFRLAVQQAEATYGISSSHPLFFFWTETPQGEMDSFQDEGYKYYLIGMLVHFGWQLLAVGLAMASFSRVGHF